MSTRVNQKFIHPLFKSLSFNGRSSSILNQQDYKNIFQYQSEPLFQRIPTTCKTTSSFNIATKRCYQSRRITTRFTFDTYKLVRQLERQGITRRQAVAIMRTINAFLVDNTLTIRSEMLANTELENELYVYKSKLQELRNELAVIRQNDGAMMKGECDEIMREIEALNNRFSDALSNLKSEITIELNNRKAESREMSKQIDLLVQEINHEMMLRMSDVRTSIEAMKMGLTQSIVWVSIGLFSVLMLLDWATPMDKDNNNNIKGVNQGGFGSFFLPYSFFPNGSTTNNNSNNNNSSARQ